MMETFSCHTILQNSAHVVGNGPCVAMYLNDTSVHEKGKREIERNQSKKRNKTRWNN